jgi:translation elongation factor EF-G
VSDDYSPAVDQGELKVASGLRARLSRRQELAPVGPGFERVLIAKDGTPLVDDNQRTPGEKRYKQACSWVSVDVGHHRLEYRVAFSDPSGHADFITTIAVDTVVVDAVAAVRSGASSVKDALEPTLRHVVVAAGESGEAVTGSRESDASTRKSDTLTNMRQRARAKVRQLEGESLEGLPSWLSATILSTTVDFDDGTRRHYNNLVGLEQQGQVIDVTSENDKKVAQGKIVVGDLWRENLLPHLSDSSQRVFEEVFTNPTEENISRAIDKANQRELALLHEVMRSFEMATKDGFFDKDDPTIRALAGFVRHQLETASGSGQTLVEGETHEVLDADPPPEDQSGDRDFSD